MNLEKVETYTLAAIGLVEGAWRYYAKPFIEDVGALVVCKAAHKLTGGILPVDMDELSAHIDQIATETYGEDKLAA